MKYQTPRAFRTALEKRLKTQAGADDMRLSKLRKIVTFDRLLARLLVVSPDKWILKGALALELRYDGDFRTTRDLDLGRYDNEAAATGDFLRAQTVDLGDYFTFNVEKLSEMGVDGDWAATRYTAEARVDNRRFERVQIDVGFSQESFQEPSTIAGPQLLEFAAIHPISIPTLPLTEHIAEKVHAYTRIYAGQRVSTRVKDLIDLHVIALRSPVNAGELTESLRFVFNSRYMHALPHELPEPPGQWQVPYRRMAEELGIPADLNEGFRIASSFLNPVLSGDIAGRAGWNPAIGAWH